MNQPAFGDYRFPRMLLAFMGAVLLLAACAGNPPPPAMPATHGGDYVIGPGDTIDLFVWREPDLSVRVPVRPDGRVTTPLVEDMMASGKTPTQLARDIADALGAYIREPVVTVTVTNFAGPYGQQVRVVGQALEPQAIPYREDMTLLDVMIAVGGLTEFAAGNRATIVRTVDGERRTYGVRLNDLIRRGDINANAQMLPGDIVIIPETRF